MKSMDIFRREILAPDNARKFLNEKEFSEFCLIPQEERTTFLQELISRPIARFTVINELYFRSKWAELIRFIYGSRPITLVEVASGDADMIPQALARSNPSSTYITANMNKQLNESLLVKTQGLDLNISLIDDDAMHLNRYISRKTADLIAFQHGVNDVLQAILCTAAGIDTVYCDWMELLPKMIQLLQQEIEQGTLEQNTKPVFLKLIAILMEELKDGGILAISHYMFQLDLDWGYPADLFENLIPMIRKWFSELAGCEEIFYEQFNLQWWLFLRKTTLREEL